ncbi:MAG: PEP-CTERM sorting domain-containing protein [Sedimentisphaerales bacterium]|nr:PEP-CTERM sorting domain-containing protein [Sedimentisphaerales bacterium]
MRRGFLILSLALVVCAFGTPVSADPSPMNPLKVDINGDNNPGVDPDPNRTQPGWQGWDFSSAPTTNTFSKSFIVGGSKVGIELRGVQNNGSMPGSRMRAEQGVENLGKVHQDLLFVSTTGAGAGLCGLDYIEMTIFMPSHAGETFQITTWSYDTAFNTYNDPSMDDYAAWSLTNPSTFGGYDPCEIRPLIPYLARTFLGGGEHDAYQYSSTFEITLNSFGKATIYGWWDGNSWEGNCHMPLNGFMIIPEPMTVALLGLGGLAMQRRKK